MSLNQARWQWCHYEAHKRFLRIGRLYSFVRCR